MPTLQHTVYICRASARAQLLQYSIVMHVEPSSSRVLLAHPTACDKSMWLGGWVQTVLAVGFPGTDHCHTEASLQSCDDHITGIGGGSASSFRRMLLLSEPVVSSASRVGIDACRRPLPNLYNGRETVISYYSVEISGLPSPSWFTACSSL